MADPQPSPVSPKGEKMIEEQLRHAVKGYRQSRKALARALGFGPDASDAQLLAEIARLKAPRVTANEMIGAMVMEDQKWNRRA